MLFSTDRVIVHVVNVNVNNIALLLNSDCTHCFVNAGTDLDITEMYQCAKGEIFRPRHTRIIAKTAHADMPFFAL